MKKLQTIEFSLGDTLHTVNSTDVGPEMTLNQYLREKVFLTGTKKMCYEGGCGSCLVAVEENVNNKKNIFVVNSCLVSILSCHGWKIHTNEGIGNPLIGFHPIQKLLADNDGTQCGFCSTGMVMNMFALHESGPKTMWEIENSFGGNLCRCTGYRPIMTAFKKLASDADTISDIEELKPCQKSECSKKCDKVCQKAKLENLSIELGDRKWLKVHNLKDLLQIMRMPENSNYRLVAGNTARGVYKNDPLPNTYIDVTGVVELINYSVDNNTLTLGGNISLTKAMDIFQEISSQKTQFSYLSVLRDHIDLIASVPVRNIGSLAGNLMIKNRHNDFPSDVFLILETFNAILVIVDVDDNETLATPKDFVKMDMNKKVIKSIVLNALPTDRNFKYLSYKIMPRAQNAHAMVNAGFLLELTNNNTVKSARIVYGGINAQFIHAVNTENLIKGQILFDNNLLRRAYKSLNQELQPDHVVGDASPEYRKNLAISLFYKFVLNIAPETVVSSRNKSGGTLLQRPVSTGVQEYGTNKSKWPLTEPVHKVEGLAQTSGIKLNGVIAFYDKSDIPGNNTYEPKSMGEKINPVQEELFCSGTVQYYHQPVGIIVANDNNLAWKAAGLVKVNCSPPQISPFLNVKDVVNDNIMDRISHKTTFLPKSKGDDVKKVIKGEFYIGSQYHFHMELQCCSVIPTEDGLDVYPATQWMDFCQVAIMEAVKIPMNKINVHVRRLGGAFGAKIMKNALLSTAAALAAVKLNAPVKMSLPLEKNMDIIGGRIPLYAKYEVGVNDNGVIQYLTSDMYSDVGIGGNEIIFEWINNLFENCYNIDRWEFSTYSVKTDNAGTTWARAPGTLEGLGAIESIMEHIARELNLDPTVVKLANTDQSKYSKILTYWNDMNTWADIENRKKAIKSYNDANRWKKRGMSLVPMVWPFDVLGQYSVLVSVFHGDGGVAVCHGGIEIGQGINTKAAQMCAYKFGISMDQVTIKPSYNIITANNMTTGGSMTSEAICYAISLACDEILAKMKPIRDQMKNPTWVELVDKCYFSNIDLTSTGSIASSSPAVKSYQIFGLCATEVEIDILTGQKQILQVDIIEDLGDSDSPLIDIGQVEGAFVMGIGYYTTEELIHNSDGKLITDRSWNYKPPGAKDIPINFRVKFPENDPNKVGLLKSKAVAEPPICLSIAVPLAIRSALASARHDADSSQSAWIPFNGTTTVEATFLASLNNFQQYTL
nr:indole-3-acetaldehyde oxidase-like [Leptinotarsa decemlineata]